MIETGKFEINRKTRLKFELKQAIHNKLMEKTHIFVEENFELSHLINDIYDQKTDIYSVVKLVTQKVIK